MLLCLGGTSRKRIAFCYVVSMFSWQGEESFSLCHQHVQLAGRRQLSVMSACSFGRKKVAFRQSLSCVNGRKKIAFVMSSSCLVVVVFLLLFFFWGGERRQLSVISSCYLTRYIIMLPYKLHHIRLNGVLSSVICSNAGAPQGTVLAPFLFLSLIHI